MAIVKPLRNVSMAETAAGHARRGWAVIPLHTPEQGKCSCGNAACGSPGKHPRTMNGLKDASADPAQVARWWSMWPEANIGIVCGAVSGLVVLDIDGPDGEETLEALAAELGPLPETVEALTGKGRHLYFNHPGVEIRPSAGVLGPALDVRGDGGYVVGPPSLHYTGRRYEWEVTRHLEDMDPADLPEAWIRKLQQKGKPKRAQRTAQAEKIPEGRRNDTLTSKAGSMRRAGFSADEILAALLTMNEHRCDPPLDAQEVGTIARSVARYDPAPQMTIRPQGGPEIREPKPQKEKLTQSQTLIFLASDAELFHTANGEAYATIPVGRHRETWPLRNRGFRRWLRQRFYEAEEKAPGAQALQDAIGVLESQAYYDGPEEVIHTRLAEKDGDIYVDLANDEWEVVEVTAQGWRVISDSPVKFRRPGGMLPLPKPEGGGRIEDLRPFVNVPDEQDWCLLVAWVVASLKPSGPYPVLVLHGEQGSAKSTTAEVLRSLIDPSIASLRTAPSEERDLAIAAHNAWVLSYDNMSGVPLWLSDALCRVATGGGFATRTLYEDAEETIFSYMRPVAVNGIDEIVTRHDLLDRSLIITLPEIPENKRKAKEVFWEAFEEARPKILGAFLDAVAVGLARLPETKLDKLPRMADFARWVSAAEPALPWPIGGFMEAYDDSRADAVAQALQADVVAVAVMELLEDAGDFEGTATELLEVLEAYVPEKTRQTRSWPKTPRTLSNRIRRAATFLRQTGVEVEFARKADASRQRIIRIQEDF
jgi:hypothetical protein